MWVGFEWNHTFANIAISYRCFNPACLTLEILFYLPFFRSEVIGLVGRGCFLSAVVGCWEIASFGVI